MKFPVNKEGQMTKMMVSNSQKGANVNAVIYPEVPQPSVRLYMMWGEEKIRKLVRYHHHLLRLGELEHLLPEENGRFEYVTGKTADYFIDSLSKGKFYRPHFIHPAVKFRFFQMTFDEYVRDIWLDAYKKAIMDMKMPSECIEEFWNWIETLSLYMINRRTKKIPERYPYQSVWTDFVEFQTRFNIA